LLVAMLPRPLTVIMVTVPSSLLMAMALLLLKELLIEAVAVEPLFAAALPCPSALAVPSLLRLVPVLLSLFWLELLELSERLELSCDAVEFSFAAAPEPPCVEVALAF